MEASSSLSQHSSVYSIITEQIIKQLGIRRSAVAKAVANGCAVQSDLRQRIPGNQSIPLSTTRLRLALLVDF